MEINSADTSSIKPIKIVLPIYWEVSKNSAVLVGLNWYRNAYHHTQNKWKTEFHDLIAQQLRDQKIQSPYRLKLDIYYKNTNCDASNIAALMDKVVLDSLQKLSITTGDSVKHHNGTAYEVIKQDKNNPRCEITIFQI